MQSDIDQMNQSLSGYPAIFKMIGKYESAAMNANGSQHDIPGYI